jgi:hypothetical protein
MAVSRRRFFGLTSIWGLLFRRPPAAVAAVYELDRFPVAGFRYHDGPRSFSRIAAGDAVELRAEPDNPHDPDAIRVEWRGQCLGYVLGRGPSC